MNSKISFFKLRINYSDICLEKGVGYTVSIERSAVLTSLYDDLQR